MNWWKRGAIALVGVSVIIQLIPYGRDHTNPPVTAEPAWDSELTRSLAVRACFDCHSNETEWKWYSNIAPVSWFIQNEVDEGRAELNFSAWNATQEGDESAETVREGEMPPRFYAITRSRLNDTELRQLEQGLIATFGEEDEDDDDD